MDAEIKELAAQLSGLQQTFGWVIAILFVVGIALCTLAWKFVVKKVEKTAEVASEKSLRKFQEDININHIKFQSQHEKQINALEEVYKSFTDLSSLIHYIMKGEKFTQAVSPDGELGILIAFRHTFKNSFGKNRLRLKKVLCDNIESLLPVIDEFIETYHGGFIPGGPPDLPEGEEPQDLYIAAIWQMGQLEDVIQRLDAISLEIEEDFRKAYGTNI